MLAVAVIAIGATIDRTSSRSSAKKTAAAAAYCATTQVDHTTALNTLVTLGAPDSRITHAGALYLTYGNVTLVYSWSGTDDSSLLESTSGC